MTTYIANQTSAGGYHQPLQTASSSIQAIFKTTFIGFVDPFASFGDIIKWMVITENIPTKEPKADLDREIAAMSDAERLAAIMSAAGTWTHLEEDDGSEWGFYDWDAPDDLPV